MSKLHDYMQAIYSDKTDYVIAKVEEILSNSLKYQGSHKEKAWYKALNLYCVYPDGIVIDQQQSPIHNISLYLPHIKQLGFNAIHLLPFLRSPMVDKGFDISDFTEIRSELGSLSELKELMTQADKLGVAVFMDMLFNHVSEEHTWFQRAEAGEVKYQNYFLHTKEKPKFIRTYIKNSSVWAEYKVNGTFLQLSIMFPETQTEIPHWRQGKCGNWYYHSYYPQQLDLDWANPEVFIEMVRVLVHWASLGFNFRLDSILYVGKLAYKTDDLDNTKTHLLMAALREIGEIINPSMVFLAESFTEMNRVQACLGNDEQVQAHLAYNFHLSTKLWLSLVNEDVSHIWETLHAQKAIPPHAAWVNFLRNHDELSLALITDTQREKLYEKLVPLGADFRKGCGISGRTFSMLNNNRQRFMMAYFLLASCSGVFLLMSGDEEAKENIPLMSLSERERRDTRNINRGQLVLTGQPTIEKIIEPQFFSELLKSRLLAKNYFALDPEEVKIHKDIFSAEYQLTTSKLSVFINLSSKAKNITLPPGEYKEMSSVNKYKLEGNSLSLFEYAGVWLINAE